MEEKTWVRN